MSDTLDKEKPNANSSSNEETKNNSKTGNRISQTEP